MAEKWQQDIKTGQTVRTSDDQTLGTVEQLHGDGFHVKGEHIPFSEVARVEGKTVFLKSAGARWAKVLGGERTRTATTNTEGTSRVPITEERLAVEKRSGELGQAEVRKTVTQEQVQVPVDLMREEVRVERVKVDNRALAPGEIDKAFQEGTIRVPVRGEEAVVTKEAVVTGEVVIKKEPVTERQTVSDTVRKEHVEVDDHYQKQRGNFQEHFQSKRAKAVGGRTREFTEAEPNYRLGVEAAHDERFRGRQWDEVEPNLRRDWETRTTETPQTTGAKTSAGRDPWEQLREEVREGFGRSKR